jgi:hypothetical protein
LFKSELMDLRHTTAVVHNEWVWAEASTELNFGNINRDEAAPHTRSLTHRTDGIVWDSTQILHQVLVAKDIITRQFSEHDFQRALLPARRIYQWILIFTQMHDVIKEQLVMGEGTARPSRMDSPEV